MSYESVYSSETVIGLLICLIIGGISGFIIRELFLKNRSKYEQIEIKEKAEKIGLTFSIGGFLLFIFIIIIGTIIFPDFNHTGKFPPQYSFYFGILFFMWSISFIGGLIIYFMSKFL